MALINADAVTRITRCSCSVLDDCWSLDVPPKGPTTTTPIRECPPDLASFVGASEGQSRRAASGPRC